MMTGWRPRGWVLAFVLAAGCVSPAKTLNSMTHVDCVSPYYKELMTPDLQVHAPPYVIGCTAQTAWMEANCPPALSRGVEMDWMQFLWAVTKPASNATTTTDLDAIFQGACGAASCTQSNVLEFEDLRSAAESHFGMFSSSYAFFANRADDHGVAH